MQHRYSLKKISSEFVKNPQLIGIVIFLCVALTVYLLMPEIFFLFMPWLLAAGLWILPAKSNFFIFIQSLTIGILIWFPILLISIQQIGGFGTLILCVIMGLSIWRLPYKVLKKRAASRLTPLE